MGQSPFLLNHSPKIGVVEQIDPDLQVVTAPNASPMTFTGTRSYILGQEHVALVDPGPRIQSHQEALISALQGRTLEAIVVTHSHVDHSPLASVIARQMNVAIYGCSRNLAKSVEIDLDLCGFEGGEGVDSDFEPDIELADGACLSGTGWELEAIHAPGHLSDHMCFSDGNRLFSGDHVMGWATSMISPPEGNLTAFMNSLDKLIARQEQVYLPGHGHVVENGPDVARYIRDHRKMRETQILDLLALEDRTVAELTSEIYSNVDRSLHRAASRNVLSHIIDLYSRGKIASEAPFSASGIFAVARK